MLHWHQSVFSLSALSSDSTHPLPLLPTAPSPLPLHHTFTHAAAILSPSCMHICSSPPPSRLCFTLHVPSHPTLLHPSSHQHPHAALPFSLPPHLLPQLICTPNSTPALQSSLYLDVSPTTLAPLRVPRCLPSISPSALQILVCSMLQILYCILKVAKSMLYPIFQMGLSQFLEWWDAFSN